MANEITIINGVTKKERKGIFRYRFGANVHIDARPYNASMIIYDIDKHKNHVVLFADIPDKLGATTIEEYVDALASGGYFQTVITGTVTATVDPTGLATSANQATQIAQVILSNASLASIDGKLTGVSTSAKQDEIITAINNISGGGGDASAANQLTQITEAQTGNSSLASIDSKTANSTVSFDVNNTILNNILEELKTITFLLKNIAE